MDVSRPYITTNQQLDIKQILVEAQHRWLRPNEVCEILRNYNLFQLTPDPPHKPSGGSLFLFDRKVLRYFRKDGHSWRKKKDGKTVREAHEKLKAGSIDVLHCYYAHGEDDDNFQRRCYWMLDTQLEHIVLVHYRVVKEGSRSTTFRTLTPDAATQTGSSQSCSAPLSAEGDSNAPTIQASYVSSPSTANFNGHTSYSELLEDLESKEDLGTSSLAEAKLFSGCPSVGLHPYDKAGNQSGLGLGDTSFIHISDRPILSDILKFNAGPPNSAELITRKLTDVKVEPFNLSEDGLDLGAMCLPDGHAEALLKRCHRVFQETLANGDNDQADYLSSNNRMQNGLSSSYDLSNRNHFQSVHSQVQHNSGSCHLVSSNGHSGFGNACVKSEFHNDESRELKKLDSFGRWMSEEIGKDCDDSLMASDSGNYWNTVDSENDDKEDSSLSQHMQLDNDSLAPSLSQEQLFSICDFSPDWAYSGIETKVLISGSFLGTRKHMETTEWCCMFGEVEVPAEVLTDNVLRCQAPLHAAGRVPFYITCSNRLACSEVRDFEYRENPSCRSSLAVISEPEDEMRLQVRLAKLLCLGMKQKTVDCSVENCEKCNIKNELTSTWNQEKKEWERMEKALEKNLENPKDSLITMLLKEKFSDWLVCSVHEEGKGPHILDDEGQGVIHLAAALGFDWVMGPIVSAGVSPSFRDAHGRTGLHWAAYYGREETVVTLVKLGAAPGAVDDPTASFPGGRTAADLASSRGHKGIGGYLAEADLTSHLSSLTLTKGSVMESEAAKIAAERAVETVSVEGVQGQLSLKSSLDAVKKSAQAAALIQASFRARSFQYRQQSKIQYHEEVPMDVVALASSSISKGRKMSHFSDYLHTAAIKIQQKYRGWKGRKEFLNVRNRIVKIQAHVRGHQVRKQYKKVVWSVSILEKVILRWRRKRVGLRGFRAEGGDSQPEARKTDEYDFLRLGRKQKVAGVEKALARVQSMIRYPEARDQYMRLATNFQNSKIGCTKNIDKDTTMAP